MIFLPAIMKQVMKVVLVDARCIQGLVENLKSIDQRFDDITETIV